LIIGDISGNLKAEQDQELALADLAGMENLRETSFLDCG
jgi:hypothetical protein